MFHSPYSDLINPPVTHILNKYIKYQLSDGIVNNGQEQEVWTHTNLGWGPGFDI